MLRLGGSNEYINSDQVGVMSPLLDQFWNQSISWTTTAGSSNTLQFIGTFISPLDQKLLPAFVLIGTIGS